MMKLGVCGWPDASVFEIAAKKGLSFLEFMVDVGSDPEAFFGKVKDAKRWSGETGVAVGSVGRWGTERILPDGKISEKELDLSYRLIDAAAELGCGNFVCGCNRVDSISYYQNVTAAIEYFSKLIERAKGKNVSIAVYNCSWNNFVVDSNAWELIHGHVKELGIKFDPSHSIGAGRDYLKETRDWGDRFYHVHIKGSVVVDGEYYDSPPAGMDQTEWGSFLGILYAKGYDRGLSIEPHSKVWSGELGDKGLDFTIRTIKQMLF